MNYFELRPRNVNLINNLRQNPLLTSHIGKTYTDILGKKNFPDARKYKDETTSNFNETFFIEEIDGINNIDNLNNFTFYVFQKINFDIISNINTLLTAHGEFIKHNEDILLVFKGGNILNYYANNILNNIDSNHLRNFFNDLKATSISDTDFSIYILNDSEPKYNVIYKYLSDLLYESLIDIRDNFENLFENKIDRNPNNLFDFVNIYQLNDNIMFDRRVIDATNRYILIDEATELNTNILTIDNEIHIILESIVFDDYQILQVANGLNNLTLQFNNMTRELIQKLNDYEIIHNINNLDLFKFSLYKDIYTASRYIKILITIEYIITKYLLYYNNNINILQVDIRRLYSNIQMIIDLQTVISNRSLENILYELNDFYTRDKITLFLNSICNKFNQDEYRKNNY
jgi:hypothetical protein